MFLKAIGGKNTMDNLYLNVITTHWIEWIEMCEDDTHLTERGDVNLKEIHGDAR